ncbi:hypothetical protein B0J14DRAFT_608316 [Halenospora varia]|nr:hypothetical protein B0J14DRAFT_608316 [Halenospora varia]
MSVPIKHFPTHPPAAVAANDTSKTSIKNQKSPQPSPETPCVTEIIQRCDSSGVGTNSSLVEQPSASPLDANFFSSTNDNPFICGHSDIQAKATATTGYQDPGESWPNRRLPVLPHNHNSASEGEGDEVAIRDSQQLVYDDCSQYREAVDDENGNTSPVGYVCSGTFDTQEAEDSDGQAIEDTKIPTQFTRERIRGTVQYKDRKPDGAIMIEWEDESCLVCAEYLENRGWKYADNRVFLRWHPYLALGFNPIDFKQTEFCVRRGLPADFMISRPELAYFGNYGKCRTTGHGFNSNEGLQSIPTTIDQRRYADHPPTYFRQQIIEVNIQEPGFWAEPSHSRPPQTGRLMNAPPSTTATACRSALLWLFGVIVALLFLQGLIPFVCDVLQAALVYIHQALRVTVFAGVSMLAYLWLSSDQPKFLFPSVEWHHPLNEEGVGD